MATTKTSRPARKSASSRSAAASTRRRPASAASAAPKTKGKTVAHRAAASRTSRRSTANAAAAAQPENPPLSPDARKSLALLKERGEKIISQLTASLAGKKPDAKKTSRGKSK